MTCIIIPIKWPQVWHKHGQSGPGMQLQLSGHKHSIKSYFDAHQRGSNQAQVAAILGLPHTYSHMPPSPAQATTKPISHSSFYHEAPSPTEVMVHPACNEAPPEAHQKLLQLCGVSPCTIAHLLYSQTASWPVSLRINPTH